MHTFHIGGVIHRYELKFPATHWYEGMGDHYFISAKTARYLVGTLPKPGYLKEVDRARLPNLVITKSGLFPPSLDSVTVENYKGKWVACLSFNTNKLPLFV